MPSPQLVLRPCLPADLAAVTAIYRHAVCEGTGTFEIEAPDLPEMTRRYTRICEKNYPYLVACAGGQTAAGDVMGYAYASPFRDRPAYRFMAEDSIYVRPDCQGLGIGAALMTRLIEDCTACDLRQMIAVIGDSENAGSIRLHEKAGFRPAGLMSAAGWKFGRWLDVVLMQRAMGPGAGLPPGMKPPCQ